ncbi:zinc finger, RING/FYVE/PHD-type [Artemisia annua]|uniref:Zinc finger, RING/FYVE/PHD-type n=1 Tax=Artemisia annua TaxID=35608 RepID=A0A2U1PUN2_ARTAN|nr:zinc finger, RING/FYVE/PHD-type [Artemisia annua]
MHLRSDFQFNLEWFLGSFISFISQPSSSQHSNFLGSGFQLSVADNRTLINVPNLGLTCYGLIGLIVAVIIGALICSLGIVVVARWVNRKMKKKRLDRVIPRFKYDSSKEDRGYGRNIRLTEACQICLTDFVDGNDILVFPQCGHAFHTRCIDKWLNVNSSCPSCRSEIQLTAL